jgi:ADP-ribosylglycohydrolase
MTVAAVVHILATSAADVTAAVEKAISLGGDTDTTAAIVGGILGSRSEDAAESIPWLQTLNFPDGYDLEIIARQLSAIRRGR